MSQLVLYSILFPFLGFLVLSIYGNKFDEKKISFIGIGSVGISAVLIIILSFLFFSSKQEQISFWIWEWINIKDLKIYISFLIDPISLIFALVVTIAGFLVHLYSVEYMKGEEGYVRFFALMNLFIGSMLILLLADNMLFLYLGWVAISFCSFMLIGFWYKKAENAEAARKSFIVTRIGDTAFLIAMFLLFSHFNTLNLTEIINKSHGEAVGNQTLINTISILLLVGAASKSAQLPLQTWMPDATAGPTPANALIHAAVMVTAGLYLMVRTRLFLMLSPLTMAIIAVTGAVTIIIAGISAMVHYDIKKVLAYSTVSQTGYVFLAFGVGAWTVGLFYFMLHTFLKVLLFLGAGSVILALNHEKNMFKMGGLKEKLPITFFTFLTASALLTFLPFVALHFFSPEQILFYSFSSDLGNINFFYAGIAGSFITAIYSFRMVFLTFFGKTTTPVGYNPGKLIEIPLLILLLIPIVFIFIALGNNVILNNFLNLPVFTNEKIYSTLKSITLIFISAGILLAFLQFKINWLKVWVNDPRRKLNRFILQGWGFDWLYYKILIHPFGLLVRMSRKDLAGWLVIKTNRISSAIEKHFISTRNPNVKWYVVGTTAGVLILFLSFIL
jgi:NADH-quinone oxidoreductase subunit L